MDKQTIIRNFSRYAYFYDRYADVQRLIGLRLLGQIKENHFSRILEIGCGTGNFTLLLRAQFSHAILKAVDISAKMLAVAKEKLKDKDVEFMVADAEGIDLAEKFNLITSNACFQWFMDLEGALAKYRNYLKPEAVIAFSIFGPYTFWELNACLKYLLRDISICAESFNSREKIKEILKRNFREVQIKELMYKESFSCLSDLLCKIKYTGVGGCNQRKFFLNKRFLENLEKLYVDKFGQINATYQVFLCWGLK